MLRHFRLFAALFASCAVAACGIKGPLELPPAPATATVPADATTPASGSGPDPDTATDKPARKP